MDDQIEVKIIADSISSTENGTRITTLQLKYHRYIHAEFMTHRVFSRSASSSRAIPIMKTIRQVWTDPAMPVHWGKNISGMQAKSELTNIRLYLAKFLWRLSAKTACVAALGFHYIGLHKQIGNRMLEPWQFINVIVTSTEFDNFFKLRIHPDAQPEIHVLAKKMKQCIDRSTPEKLGKDSGNGTWHLPYISHSEKLRFPISILLKVSVARCARVSYNNHDGSIPDIGKDIALHDMLVGSEPLHASPAEHQAFPIENNLQLFYKNFRGWEQYRTIIEENI